ncbi:hypothetical protein ADINL_1485 [Nitrincola lacisaponensis]|uniref:Uncharacterized protein n=1 Tax=Nitrincola lacisaponensis TaxID=267850 RepID=A0A063Y0J3_9GAMM|nr:hypothetical protein ADINL_1485 [Nitrincola lacisaponensis]
MAYQYEGEIHNPQKPDCERQKYLYRSLLQINTALINGFRSCK